MALPPDAANPVGKVVFRITDLEGKTLGEYPGTVETFEAEGNFRRAMAQYPSDHATPGAHQLTGIVYDTEGKELTRVAPRMVSVNMEAGYGEERRR
jgi:hypothetical protein